MRCNSVNEIIILFAMQTFRGCAEAGGGAAVDTYLLEQKGLLLLVDQSLQLAGGQELLHLLGSHHSPEDVLQRRARRENITITVHPAKGGERGSARGGKVSSVKQ